MSLDTEKLHRLNGKAFDTLYASNRPMWHEMVEKARNYADECVGENEHVRIGDIVLIVQNAIRIHPTFEKHVEKKKLTQKFWVVLFAEYIVDAVYPQTVP